MRIHEIELIHFRNHTHTKVAWAPYINILIGPNGAGNLHCMPLQYLHVTKFCH